LEERSGGIKARCLPQVEATKVAGGGRNRQAAVAAIRVMGEEREERGESVLTAWFGLTDPMAQLVDLV
jgi:hypothetical protein